MEVESSVTGSAERKLQELRKIYDQERQWGGDRLAVPKNLGAINPDAKLAVLGEAVGPRTLRFSGVSYFDCHGKIGASGRYLDDLLSNLGFTVYPGQNITVPGGAIDAASGRGRVTAYFSDLCPLFPGSRRMKDGKRRIQRPTPKLIESALSHNFLVKELSIVKPRVILLLGQCAYAAMYRYLLKSPPKEKISTLNFAPDVFFPAKYEGAAVIPMLHPSPASPTFLRWFNASGPLTAKQTFIYCVARCLAPGIGH